MTAIASDKHEADIFSAIYDLELFFYPIKKWNLVNPINAPKEKTNLSLLCKY